jgi:hypothetical protein
VVTHLDPIPLPPRRRRRDIETAGSTSAAEPFSPPPPPPPPAPEFDGLDPLLERFLSLDREALLAIPGMTPDRVKHVMEARQGCRVWADLEARLGHDPDLMNAIYFKMAGLFAGGLARGRSGTLFVGSAPTNTQRLDLEGEYGVVREHLNDVAIVRDPTVGLLRAIVATGRFEQVWISGHGLPGEVIFTGEDGLMVRVPAQDIAQAVSNSPAVKAVIGSVCYGAFGGQKSVVETIAAHGPSAMGYEWRVQDDHATAMSTMIAEKLAAGVPLTKAVEEAHASVFAGRFGVELATPPAPIDADAIDRDADSPDMKDIDPDPTAGGMSHVHAIASDQVGWTMEAKDERFDQLQSEYPWIRDDEIERVEAENPGAYAPDLVAARVAEEFEKGKPFAQATPGFREEQGGRS